jgi:hypothetical protein
MFSAISGGAPLGGLAMPPAEYYKRHVAGEFFEDISDVYDAGVAPGRQDHAG